MKHTHDSVREEISALADGGLHEADFARVAGAMAVDEALTSTWRTYHLIGDVLRSGAHAPCSDAAAFMARLQHRMAAEGPLSVSAPEVPTRPLSDVLRPVAARPAKIVVAQAANEPVFRWKLVAGAASLAAVAAIGWSLVGIGGAPAETQMARQESSRVPQTQQQMQQEQIADGAGAVLDAAPTSTPVLADARLESTRVQVGNGEPQVMLRDPRLDVLLEAHRQAGGASQMPSGFLRNATFDGPSR